MQYFHKHVYRLALLGLLFGVNSAAWAAGPDLAQAESLLRAGKPGEAYALLEPHEFEQAGNLNFDYLLGVAALDTQRPQRATLILERVIAVDPNFAGARLDLARAYFAQGSHQQARAEFNTVLGQNPPPEARKVVLQYLEAIDAQTRPQTARLTGYLEASFGFDSNVNSSTGQATFNSPLIPFPITLDSSSTQTGDRYVSFGGGLDASVLLTPGLSLTAGVDYRRRIHGVDDAFDYAALDGRLGLVYAESAWSVRAGLTGGLYTLDNHSYRRSVGHGVELRLNPDSHNQYSVFVQNSKLRYPAEALTGYNVNQRLLGGGWMHALGTANNPVVFATVFAGDEHDTNDRTDGAKVFGGFRLGGQITPRPDVDAFVQAGWQNGRYDAVNPLFSTKREETQYDLSLGVNWRPAMFWQVRPQVTFTKVDSNFSIYQYDRSEWSVTVRRDFR